MTPPTPRQRSGRHRSGFVMIYAMFAVIILMAFTSLAVDWGRVETAKCELEVAADAAARYAATGISDSTAAAKAIQAAGQNYVDGSTLTLQSSDIDVGTWTTTPTKGFSVGGSSPNAVRVNAHRTQSRGNAIPLLFGRAIGRTTCDINATSIAAISIASASPNIVGLDSVNMSGTAAFSRYTGESGTMSVASNGNWNMNTGTITGDVYYRSTAPSGSISGTKTAMTSDLAFTSSTTPTGAYPLGNVNVSSNQSLSGGTYSATSVNISAGTITLYGNVDLYVDSNFSMSGGTINTNGTGYKLRIFINQASGFNYNASGTLYASIYAPTSPANINAGTIVGSLVAKSISINSAKVQYSSSLPVPISPTGGALPGGGSVSLVK